MPTLKNGPEPVIKADTFFDSCQLTITCMSNTKLNTVHTIHSTKISGNFGPKLNESVRSNRKSSGKTGPPFEVVLFSRSDRSEFWLNGSRPADMPSTPSHVRSIFSVQPTVR